MSQARPICKMDKPCARPETPWSGSGDLPPSQTPSLGQLCPALQQPAWSGPKDTGHMEKGTEGHVHHTDVLFDPDSVVKN